ncbi:MAG: HAD-IIIA family hydrolase [Proteobacteria bacterium]|nr:HAD-IIIA family hydrolase [Pseudomonadota bacterium]
MLIAEEILKKAEKIKILLTDVDGVLTDGRIIYDSEGKELKFFHVRDGHGIKMLVSNGIEVGIITGRNSTIVNKRAEELGIKYVIQNAHDKGKIIEEFLRDKGVNAEEICYIGDDIVDLPVFMRVGLKITVPDAPLEVQKYADYITLNYAGRGAVREVCEIILRAKGLWDKILTKYLFV